MDNPKPGPPILSPCEQNEDNDNIANLNQNNTDSEDDMQIEPLFADLNLDENTFFQKNLNVDHITPKGLSKIVVETNPSINVNLSDVRNRHDVTVLPEEVNSFSQLLYFTSERTNRLQSLRNTAIWRAMKLLGGWICIILFVFWLSSIFSPSSFPSNPFKHFLRKRTKDEEEGEKIVFPSTCYEEIYGFSRWDKFTEERPKTHIFCQGRTYTYDKLPSFPKKKPRKSKSKTRINKKDVASSTSYDIVKPSSSILPVTLNSCIVNNSVLNPLALPFDMNSSDDRDCRTSLKSLRLSNVGNIIIAHLNINSLRNKFDSLIELIESNIDVLIIGETKLGKSFPDAQFK